MHFACHSKLEMFLIAGTDPSIKTQQQQRMNEETEERQTNQRETELQTQLNRINRVTAHETGSIAIKYLHDCCYTIPQVIPI